MASRSSRMRRAGSACLGRTGAGRASGRGAGRSVDTAGCGHVGSLRARNGAAALAVQRVIADGVELPAHGIMERVGARVTPEAVEAVLGQDGARAGELEELARGRERYLGREHLGLGDGDGGGRHRVLVLIGQARVDGASGLLQHGLGGMQVDRELAPVPDHVRLLPRVLDAAVGPGAGLLADEADGRLEGAPGDPASMAAWMICATGPCTDGVSKARQLSITWLSGTKTSSRTTVPLAVVRWPKPDQSSITVRPWASRSTMASGPCRPRRWPGPARSGRRRNPCSRTSRPGRCSRRPWGSAGS